MGANTYLNPLLSACLLLACGPLRASDFNDLPGARAQAVREASGEPPAPARPGTPPPAARRSGTKWYGTDSRRARLTFESYFLYAIPQNYAGAASRILDDAAQFDLISETLGLQLRHMYGAFTVHPYFDENPGIPSGDYRAHIISAEKVPNEPYVKIRYSYDDIAVFARSVFAGGARRLQFVLPKDPAAIYSRGFASPYSSRNLCTDEHYNSEDDFWYFWNPYQAGCPIRDSDLVTIRADIRPMNSTRATYPDYRRLYGSGRTAITYLVGIDENFRSGDLGRRTFRDAFAALQTAGFRVTSDEPRRKRLALRDGGRSVSIDMRLVDPNSYDFAEIAAAGLKNSDVFLYDGHSGLGGYLDPARLSADSGGELTLPADKYQIFYFNGCSTYAYYSSPYFRLKSVPSDPRGTADLDIITTGIGADFAIGAAADVSFLTAIASGTRPSWQEIMDGIHAASGDSSALTHVNGDEDNPAHP